ncbi:MAG TPA: aminopeptidase P family N-terminal domain-containing protein, partial [Lachnospiraceae bacterium]|nr:aminopeptidase P family N-terminal domain-containing protein [Lachnospiraceae bacterium]
MDMKEKVISILEELQIDAVLVSDGFNMRYISGFTGATGYLYISRTKSVILTDFRYTIQANNESKGFEVIEISKGGYTEAINDLLASDQVKRLGFEDGNVLYNSYQSFTEKLNMQEMVPVKDSLTRLRIVKTSDELENIRMAEHIGDIAFTKILDVIKPGITELEIAAHLEFLMKTNGAQGLSFETIVASGVNSSMPHAT